MGRRSELRRTDRRDWEPLRRTVGLPVMFKEHGVCPLPVKLAELWVTGCRLDAGYLIKCGVPAIVRIEGLAPLHGKVVAFEDGFAELRFDVPLHLSIVRHICGAAREGYT